jgi:hypothetical protein
LALSAVVALASLAVPATAQADGDPASDVLVSQAAFIPWDAKISTAETAHLQAVIAAARRAGYPTRVAVIASPADLGSVAQLWQQPQLYARFLGIELSLAVRASVIVVMPDGDGVYHPGIPEARVQAVLRDSRRAAKRRHLGAFAVAAVNELAAASGHRPSAPQSAAASAATSRRASAHPVAWAAFAAGVAVVLLAWAGSLRMKPLRSGRRALPPAHD